MATKQATRPVAGFQSLDELRQAIVGDVFGACDAFYQIEHRDGSGLGPATLWPHQERMFQTMLDQRRHGQPARILCLKTRRAGTSTAAALWTFHHVFWKPRQHGLLLAHHDASTAFLYQIYRTLYDELPPELQQPLQKLNRKEIACEAPWSSTLAAQTAGYLDIGRGMTLQHVHVSEIDFVADPDPVLDGVLNTVHWSPDTSIIIESTANGADGWLHNFWRESLAGKTGFAPLFQPWFSVPAHRAHLPDEFELTKEEREWQREFTLDEEQIYWYRLKRQETIAKEPWGGDRKIKQEFPFTADQAFISSGMCVFPDVVLAHASQQVAPPTNLYRLIAVGGGNFEMLPTDEGIGDFAVWEEPQPDAFYAHGIDIGGGVGRTESVVSIWKWPGYVQVAEWASKNTSVDGTAFVARWLAEMYGGPKALVIPEINKDGPMILFILQNLPGSYEIYRWRHFDKTTPIPSDNPKLGWECVVPEAKILTTDLRWVPADTVQPGDEILGCQEKRTTGRDLQLGVQEVLERKVFQAPIVEVTLANGRTTRVSANHPFWVGRPSQPQWRWIQAAKLRRGDLLKCLPLWEPLRTYDAGRLSAFLDGEGHLSQGRRSGLQLLISQAEGPLADEIAQLWPDLGFPATFKWVRHKERVWEKPVATVGLTRSSEVLRALGSLRPTRLLRSFTTRVALDRMSVRSFPSVAVSEIRFVGEGAVIGLETSPDHTLIADGIVGHNTNSITKTILAQVWNLVFLRGINGTGEGVVRSHDLALQMRKCIDILPGRRWQAIGGLSDRIIAALIAVLGCYVEFEGGSVNELAAVKTPPGQHTQRWREPGSFDTGDDIFEPARKFIDRTRPEWDFE